MPSLLDFNCDLASLRYRCPDVHGGLSNPLSVASPFARRATVRSKLATVVLRHQALVWINLQRTTRWCSISMNRRMVCGPINTQMFCTAAGILERELHESNYVFEDAKISGSPCCEICGATCESRKCSKVRASTTLINPTTIDPVFTVPEDCILQYKGVLYICAAGAGNHRLTSCIVSEGRPVSDDFWMMLWDSHLRPRHGAGQHIRPYAKSSVR